MGFVFTGEVLLYSIFKKKSAVARGELSILDTTTVYQTGVPHLREKPPPLGLYRRPVPRVLGGS